MADLSNFTLLISTFLAVMLLLIANAISGKNRFLSNKELKPVLKLMDEGRYSEAIDQLNVKLKSDPENADILALLGSGYRGALNYDKAVSYYRMSLFHEPTNKDVYKKLGELYLATDQLDKAQQQLELLDSLSVFTSRESVQLNKSIEQYRQQTIVT